MTTREIVPTPAKTLHHPYVGEHSLRGQLYSKGCEHSHTIKRCTDILMIGGGIIKLGHGGGY